MQNDCPLLLSPTPDDLDPHAASSRAMSADISLRRSESLSKIPRSSSRPKLHPRDSILTKTNSLNPVLRINRSASASIATSSETFHAQRSRTNSERSLGTKKSQSQSHQDERSRRTSSESLRSCLERAPSPAPSAASSKSSPSSFMRRSSSSHSSLNSSPSSLRTPDRGLHIRNTSTASAPAVQNTVSFPSNYSPTHSTSSSTSTAPSLDVLKSSLRDTLAHYQPNGDGRSSTPGSTHIRQRPERRSVSFMLDEAQPISEAAKAESSQSITVTSTATSSPSTIISSRTSASSSTVQSYPETDWQPLSQDDDLNSSSGRMPILPLQLARYIIGLSEKDPLALETSEASSERDSIETGTQSPVITEARCIPHEVVYRNTSTIVKVVETFLGLWLAVIWLTIGRIVGSDRSR